MLAAVVRARAAGDRAEVERLEAEMARLVAEHPAAGGGAAP
jgi:hypothetical protein